MESFLPFYFRLVTHRGSTFGITKGGNFFSHFGDSLSNGWKYLDNVDFPGLGFKELNYFNDVGNMRHAHMISYKGNLLVFYTRIGDSPEQIYVRSITVGNEDNLMAISKQMEVMQPRLPFECQLALPVESQPGPSEKFELALRDPFVFIEGDVQLLFYSYGGESGIGVCNIELDSIVERLGMGKKWTKQFPNRIG